MRKRFGFLMLMVLVLAVCVSSAMACTTYAIGKNATADGSTMVTHTCDSTGDDFRMWIIPRTKGGEGVMRDIVVNGNTWGDWSQYPEVKDYGGGMVIGEMPQLTDTYQYLHTNYSIINENGVAMGESTCMFDFGTEKGNKLYELLLKNNNGLIDCYQVQHVGLSNAKTAREAVQIMGDVVEEYGWNTIAENINICDGNEVWVMEIYGLDLWCAVKIPDDGFFVCGNRCRINEIDFNDPENYMWSPNLVPFAIENGLWSEDSGVPFQPANIYATNDSLGCYLREWRAFDLVAPSLNLQPEDYKNFPLWVVPEKKLSVQDVFEMNGDYYAGTEFDVTKTAEAGPYGNPLNEYNRYRPINMYRATYHFIANIKGWLPDEVKCLIWHGYGASDSTYITPMWASQTRISPIYQTGSRYGKFDRDSNWWVASYVQQTATQNYENAIKEIHAARADRMEAQYKKVEEIQAAATALIEAGYRDAAVEMITDYAVTNSEDWHEYWLEFGDELYGTYMFNRIDMQGDKYPQWWRDILSGAPLRPLDQ